MLLSGGASLVTALRDSAPFVIPRVTRPSRAVAARDVTGNGTRDVTANETWRGRDGTDAAPTRGRRETMGAELEKWNVG